MSTLLIRNARVIATMDDASTELADALLLIRDRRIEAIGPAAELPADADEVIDAREHLVIPRPGQYPSPHVPVADPRGARRPGCGAVLMVARPVSDLGRV
jgi:hypothetical protein